MQHVAILRKSNIRKGDDLLGDILAGRKTIESRWYVNRVAPWNNIKEGETIYLKESGMSVTAGAKVEKVLQFENITPKDIRKIITKYGTRIAPRISISEFLKWGMTQKNKRYVILVFLKDVQKVKSFNIDKTGFGISSAWICVGDINRIKIH